MASAEGVKRKIQELIDDANTVTGGTDTDLTAAFGRLVAGFGQGGGGMKLTEYNVTENDDRSLWLNKQQIKLVKGINILLTSKFDYASGTTKYVQGALALMIMLWDGVAVASGTDASVAKSHLRGICFVQNSYKLFAGTSGIAAGNTTEYSIAEDGTISFVTSATGVTTGNYTNNFIEGGYTYRLVQIESDTVC
ncbi:MAG: hypothetical protein IKT63_02480 [Oscillospiraceae bacterium]|nr:hypothetical protein [Oscillospiraceae bacterium]